MVSGLEKQSLVDLDAYPDWARTPLLIVANRNFLTACVVMFLIFLPNIIWGRSAPIHNARRKQYARDAWAEKRGKQGKQA